MCLLERPLGILFTGDTYYPATLIAHLEGSDFSAYLTSLEYLNRLLSQVAYLCPSHNEVYADKEKLTDALRAFESVKNDSAPFREVEGTRVYRFDGFGLRIPN
jgi:glyoxylase-like metal-dependent hydrolase (beta-lactamase superfamily II)